MTEVLDFPKTKGADSLTPPPKLYVLNNGALLWSTSALPTADGGYEFDGARTIVMVPQGAKIGMVKLSEDMGKPESVLFLPGAVQSVRECRDESLNQQCRAALAGIVLGVN